ncbi:male-specific histamine-binding salivary protein-like [Dermacentor andersoni]|uniref:male-specific histamine-binding salivary protein-like n=1 Tax=Dermacentor andersoni TaxID=34620 RepID=UPI00215561EF|nr:uncharacterized protein LOC126540180 [Dermacentor andersoni]
MIPCNMKATSGSSGEVLLLALLLSAAFSFSRSQIERKPEYAEYQDAWKALKVPGKYYLYMRSYEYEPYYKERKCVYNELISVNEEEQYTVNDVGDIDPITRAKSNRTAYAWVRATDGYPIPDVIQTSTSATRDKLVEYPVAFTEYKNCEILRVPHRGNGCELWAKAEEVHKIESLCFFAFHLLCGPGKYMVYDEDLCGGE